MKKPAQKVKYNIDESSDDASVKRDQSPEVVRDKNMVAWFRQYEHTLPKAVL